MRNSRLQFVREQGYSIQDADDRLYSALMLQPRIIGALVVLGALLQSAWLFAALSAVLWWSTLVPTRSPFDAIYNLLVARIRGFKRLGIARPPRRFAQGMAATFTLAIGAALLGGFTITALVLQLMVIASVAAVVFRDFCGPANLFNSIGRTPGEQAI